MDFRKNIKLRRVYLEEEGNRLIRKLVSPRNFILIKHIHIYLLIGFDKYVVRRIEDLFKKGKHWIRLENNYLVIENKSRNRKYELSKLEALEIRYNKLKYENGAYSNEYFLSSISFSYSGSQEKVFFQSPKNAYLRFCRRLYQEGVVFKEYCNRRRVFMGKKPNYEKIQELKAEYGFDW